MIPLDFNFCCGGEIAIIDMRTHVLLLDYSNNTFRKFDSVEQLKSYAKHIPKMIERMEQTISEEEQQNGTVQK